MANTKVTGDVIANGTISTVHLADDAITAAKLDSTATGITFADLTIDTNTLYVDAANNRVGIGTASPITKLHVSNAGAEGIEFTPGSGGNINTTQHYNRSTSNYVENRTIANNHTWFNGSTQVVTINGSGNVGIKTASPNVDFEVSDNSSPTIAIANSDTSIATTQTIGMLEFASNNETSLSGAYTVFSSIRSDSESSVIGTGTVNGLLSFYTASANSLTERMRIDSSGNLSLATATSLDFNVADFAQIKFKESGAITIDSDNNQSSRNFQFKDGDGSSLMFIGDDGNVGIGTTSPSQLLNLSGNTNSYSTAPLIRFDSTSTASANVRNWAIGPADSDYGNFHIYKSSTRGGDPVGTTQASTFTIDYNGNIGIGTYVPLTKLHLGGTAPLDSIIRQDSTVSGTNWEIGERAAGKWQIWEDDGDKVVATFMSTGNVGIGTDSPDRRLTVGGVDATEGINLKTKSGSSVWTIWSVEQYFSQEGYMRLFYDNVSKIQFRANGDSFFNGGDVGIGTTSPSYKLHVEDAAADIFYGATDATSGSMFRLRSNNKATTIFDINASGNVGIGTTSPGYTFTVAKSITNDWVGLINNTYNGAGNGLLIDAGNGSSGEILRLRDRNGNSKVSFLSNGNVGIGTTLPSAKLEVVDGDNYAKVGDLQGNSTMSLRMADNAGYPVEVQAYGTELRFNTTNTSGGTPSVKMNILTNGNVGIGYTNPSYKLQVLSSKVTTTNIGCYVNAQGASTNNYAFYADCTQGTSTNFAFYAASGKSAFLNDVGIGNDSPAAKLHVAGRTITGSSTDYASNNDGFSTNTTTRENGGLVTLVSNGEYRYYERVCQISTGSGSAGYWHIKTNINWSNSFVMYIAKFYGYLYGQAAIMDITTAGYAYTSGPISTNVINNSTNSSSVATYASTDGKLVFRVDLGGSTYYAGLWMDIGFQNPTGGSIDFEILAQGFNTGTTYY